jgi:periodic tryptophan protein 2
MKFNYKLRRVCGSYYGRPIESNHSIEGPVGTQWTGSNVLYNETDGSSSLISAVLNRIQIVDLKTVEVRTLPIETRSNIAFLSLSPVAPLLVTVDTQNYVSLIHTTRGIVWHRWKLPSHTSCIPQFAPKSGKYLAFGVGSNVQVWCLPTESSPLREFAPLHLHRTYSGLTNDVTHIAWSLDESVLVASSRDGTLRLWTVNTVANYQPITLAGHKTSVIGVYIGSPTKNTLSTSPQLDTLYSISADGTLVGWTCTFTEAESIDLPPPVEEENEIDFGDKVYLSGPTIPSKRQRLDDQCATTDAAHELVKGHWKVSNRYYFQQEGGVTVISTSFSRSTNMFAVGFSSGVFGLYEMPNCVNVHTLSVGMNQSIQSCVLNASGSWLAIGCPISQQLLVWEWQSETYILKQRGHAYGMRCMAYSPDSVCIATGGEDGKLKLWSTSTGFCYVTFPESTHTAAITGVSFANASVVVSASLDGTVKAHDLHRYRTFKTLTSPAPLQFLSLAVDTAGELVVAGSSDPFHICVWNLQTGQLLDMLTGHAGPICDLQFLQGFGVLVSASWDGTVKTWDLFKGSSGISMESYQHSTDVVCVAVSPTGRQICSGTMGGLLSFWNTDDHKLLYEIDGRRDITGGRNQQDRVTSQHNANSRYFTSICYSADGMYLLAGGNSKYVCIYEISQQMLVKKFQMSHNRSLDGILDEVRPVVF